MSPRRLRAVQSVAADKLPRHGAGAGRADLGGAEGPGGRGEGHVRGAVGPPGCRGRGFRMIAAAE